MAGSDAPILTGQNLVKRYGGGWGRKAFVAVDGVSVAVRPGETLGIVGESGSGKSTLARMLVGLLRPDGGEVLLDGCRVRPEALRRRAQFVFQDPSSAFNPRLTVGRSVEAPLVGLLGMARSDRRARVLELLQLVGLRPDHAGRWPHEFSGGQLQRIGIARALGSAPDVLVLDEPVSALDVSVQAQVLALLRRLRESRGLAMIFVSHDLAVVEALCDRVAVMRSGQIVEEGPARETLSAPREAYTGELIAAARFEPA